MRSNEESWDIFKRLVLTLRSEPCASRVSTLISKYGERVLPAIPMVIYNPEDHLFRILHASASCFVLSFKLKGSRRFSDYM